MTVAFGGDALVTKPYAIDDVHLNVLRELGMAVAGIGETAAEAAEPAFVEAGGARVALIAAASSLGAGWPASDPAPGIEARPGVNALRFQTRYLLEPETFAQRQRVAHAGGAVGESHSSNTNYQPTQRPSFADEAMLGFQRDPRIWESILPHCSFKNSRLCELTLHRVTLGFGRPRGRRGQPSLASKVDARRILQRLDDLSRPFATRVKEVDAVGRLPVSS